MLVLILYFSKFSQLRKYKTLYCAYIIRSTLKAIYCRKVLIRFCWSYIQLFSQHVSCINRIAFIFNGKISKPVPLAFEFQLGKKVFVQVFKQNLIL